MRSIRPRHPAHITAWMGYAGRLRRYSAGRSRSPAPLGRQGWVCGPESTVPYDSTMWRSTSRYAHPWRSTLSTQTTTSRLPCKPCSPSPIAASGACIDGGGRPNLPTFSDNDRIREPRSADRPAMPINPVTDSRDRLCEVRPRTLSFRGRSRRHMGISTAISSGCPDDNPRRWPPHKGNSRPIGGQEGRETRWVTSEEHTDAGRWSD